MRIDQGVALRKKGVRPAPNLVQDDLRVRMPHMMVQEPQFLVQGSNGLGVGLAVGRLMQRQIQQKMTLRALAAAGDGCRRCRDGFILFLPGRQRGHDALRHVQRIQGDREQNRDREQKSEDDEFGFQSGWFSAPLDSRPRERFQANTNPTLWECRIFANVRPGAARAGSIRLKRSPGVFICCAAEPLSLPAGRLQSGRSGLCSHA